MSLISTQRLTGRPAIEADAAFAAALLARPEVARWTTRARLPGSAEEASTRMRGRAKAWAAHWTTHGFGLRVWTQGGADVVLAGLQFRAADGAPLIEASFAVTPERWGEGLAREAMGAALAAAPAICREVAAVSYLDNARGLRTLAALGFEEVDRTGEGAQARSLHRLTLRR